MNCAINGGVMEETGYASLTLSDQDQFCPGKKMLVKPDIKKSISVYFADKVVKLIYHNERAWLYMTIEFGKIRQAICFWR